MSAISSGAVCPSCGRFVGPLERCPYCGAAVSKRLPLRYLRLGSIALAIVGVVALLYAAHGSPTPQVTVASVGATMNYAYVRLEGQVCVFSCNSQNSSHPIWLFSSNVLWLKWLIIGFKETKQSSILVKDSKE